MPPFLRENPAVDIGQHAQLPPGEPCVHRQGNAVIESFWARMQVELLNRRRWRTRLELSNAIFEHLEIFHNRKRRHPALGMLTPVEYEIRHATTPARNTGHTSLRENRGGSEPAQ